MTSPTRVLRTFNVMPFAPNGRDFDQLVDRLFHGNEAAAAGNPVDIREDADHIYVEAEIPGLTKEQIDITLEQSVLTLSADQKQDKPRAGYLLSERRPVKFSRRFKLPATVDESSVIANLKDGILTVTLSKRPETKLRKITVA